MQVKSENIEKNLVRLEIESTPELIEEALSYAFRKRQKDFRVNGFRPGKAPRNAVEKVYGKEVLYNDAIDYVISKDYYNALEELKLEVVSDPQKIDVKEFSPEKALFTIDVYTKPEVKLGQYKELEVTKVSAEVSEEDLQKALEMEAEKNSSMKTVDDRPAQLGDTVVMDFDGYIDGVQFEGGKGENYSLKLGSGQFIPGFEDQMVGMNIDEEKTIQVKFPEDYHSEECKGKDAEFKVKVHEIKVQEIPELNDEFASDISEFETLAEYKENLRGKMADRKAKQAKEEMENEAIKKAVENTEIDLPACMIEAGVDEEVRRFESQIKMYGMTMDQYLKYMNATMDDFRERTKPQAEANVRRDLMLEEIAKTENIEATQEEIDKEFADAAEYLKKPVEEVKRLYAANTDAVIRDIRLRKAAELISGSIVPVEKKEEEKAAEAEENA